MALDFYPGSMESRATWHSKFAVNVVGLAAKYNITAGQLTAITNDNTWIQFWVAELPKCSTFESS